MKLLALTFSFILFANAAFSIQCGNTVSGFNQWKGAFAKIAKKEGIKAPGLSALSQANYATDTISADRNQKTFRYSLSKFMQTRGAETIVARGRKRKGRKPKLLCNVGKEIWCTSGCTNSHTRHGNRFW